MNNTDPFSPEARDPFYVPDRTSETVSFLGAGMIWFLEPVALLFVPLRPKNLLTIMAMGLFGLLLLLKGTVTRRHRLSRAKQVEALRARLASRDGDAPST